MYQAPEEAASCRCPLARGEVRNGFVLKASTGVVVVHQQGREHITWLSLLRDALLESRSCTQLLSC